MNSTIWWVWVGGFFQVTPSNFPLFVSFKGILSKFSYVEPNPYYRLFCELGVLCYLTYRNLWRWESDKNHKILKFPILRASVKAYQNNLNTHKSYSKFRSKRSNLREKKKKISGLELTDTLNNYAQTGSEYTKILNQIIKQNRLTDFEPVRLVNSVKKIELTS